MSGHNFNITDRLAAKKGLGVFEIFTMNDFPDPVGDVITLSSGTYILKNSLTTANRFFVDNNEKVTILVEDVENDILTYTGDSTFFFSDCSLIASLQNMRILCTGTNAKFVDINCGQYFCDNVQVVMSGINSSIGNVTTVFSSRIRETIISGFKTGLELKTNQSIILEKILFISNKTGTDTLITIRNGVDLFIDINDIIVELDPAESIFYISPDTQVPVKIFSVVSRNASTFFEVGTTGLISGFVDVSVGVTPVTVSDSGGNALFSAIGHGLNIGEKVTHTTFSESTYNGTFVVTVATSDTYEVGLIYESDDAGLFETTTTQVNATAHGLSNGDTLSIFGTINFNCGYSIFNVQTNTFEISIDKPFPGNETTGNWDTSSLTEKNKYISVSNSDPQKDSSNHGGFVVGANTEDTEINTKDVFEDLNLDGSATPTSDIELWTLIDSTIGELRYDGLAPVSLHYFGFISCLSYGGVQHFDFRLLKNGSPLPSPDNVDIPLEVGTTLTSSTLLWGISVSSGDVFKLQVANRAGTSDINIDTLKVNIS